MTTTHYLPGTRTIATCGKTTAAIRMDQNLVSIFSADVNCGGCLAEIKRMAELGFVPKR